MGRTPIRILKDETGGTLLGFAGDLSQASVAEALALNRAFHMERHVTTSPLAALAVAMERQAIL